MMPKSIPGLEEVKILVRLAKLMPDREAFLLLWELTCRTKPAGIVELARSYGADAGDLKPRLRQLTQLGLAQKKGQAYIATRSGVIAVRFLERAVEGVELNAGNAFSERSSLTWDKSSGAEDAPVAKAFTNNGTWMGFSTRGFVLSDSRRVERPGLAHYVGSGQAVDNVLLGQHDRTHAASDYARL